MLPKLAAWCYRRRRLVVVAWIVLLVGVNVLAKTAGGDLLKSLSLPGTESQKTFDIMKKDFALGGDTGYLVFKANGADGVRSAAVKNEIEKNLAPALRKTKHVASVLTPYERGGERFISTNGANAGKIAYAEIRFDVQANDVPVDLAKTMRSVVKKANTSNLQFELGGSMFTDQTQPASEAIGILAAVLILLVAFGSVLAMGLPIMTALFGIGIGLAIVTLLARFTDVPSFAPQVTAMIGIGVGIDYALFISTRYREALHEGLDPEQAVVHSIDTSGRAVLFAGGTVVISLLGLFLIGLSFIRGLSIGAALAVLLVMAAAVTLLPAVLGFVGHTIDKWALPMTKRPKDPEHTIWARWARTIQRRPWPVAIVGLLVLVALAIPAMGLRLGIADAGNDPTKFTTRRAYDLLSEGFGPGFNGPLLVASEVKSPGDIAAMAKVAAAITKSPDVAAVTPVIPSKNGQAVFTEVFPKGSPQDASTTQLVHRLRDTVIPQSVVGSTLQPHVGGQTSVGVDLADTLGTRLPYMFLAILLLSFVLLTLVFRSLLVPLKAVIMNLLSIGAAYGVIVAIFQNGWLGSLVGIGKKGPIEAWIPMMLFAIVFGLSMDYEVFLLSRIKEEYDRDHDNAVAVSHGLAKTARLITAAAAIMICVFGSFVLSDLRVLKLIGFGLAFAVFIDATVVRLVLVPATMELLGDRNWWFPKMLEWLPRIHVEGTAPALASEPAPEPEPALGS
ncbi:MAG TPA: MMPL family transporter [Acidimicrobiia bacterium]|nr:MMPL family transporter [Acidimicrobiia bacterium]